MGFRRIVVQGVWDLVGRWKCTVVLVEEGPATTVVLLEFKSSMPSNRGTTPQHPEPPPAEKGAQSGGPLVDLRREARERDAVSAQVLHSFLFDFVPRELEALVRRKRVGSLGLDERSGLVAGFVFAPPNRWATCDFRLFITGTCLWFAPLDGTCAARRNFRRNRRKKKKQAEKSPERSGLLVS